MTRKVVFSLMIFTFFIFYLYLVVLVIGPFWRVLAWAAIVGILTRPIFRRLQAYFGRRERLAAIVMTLMVLLGVVIPVVMLLLLLTQEVTQLYLMLEKGALEEKLRVLATLGSHPLIAPIWDKLQPWLNQVDLNLQKTLLPTVQSAMTFLAGYSTGVLKNIFIFILKMMVLVTALFFFYYHGNRMLDRFWSVIPLGTDQRKLLANRVENILSSVIYGIFLTCLVQGFLGGIGFWISGLPSPVLFGVLITACAIIPMVGTVPIWLPAGLYLVFVGEVGKGTFLLLWGALVVSSIDNVIRPLFISGRGKIPLLVVMIGVLGGISAFGFVGVVLGPLILSLALFFLDLYHSERLPKQILSASPGQEKPKN